MNLKYRIEITKDNEEGGYIISYPELVGCTSSGTTIEETIKNGEEARKEYSTFN